MSEIPFSDTKSIIHHYDPEVGIGNAYKFWADWPQAIKAILFGWERTLDHPAQFHYALDFDGTHLNDAINRTTFTMFGELGIKEGHILDAGCGIGGASLLLAGKYPKVRFTSVTLSEGQIEMARRRALKNGVSNVDYLVANYLKLPFSNKEFDGILGIETFCYVPDDKKLELLKGMHRVLKPKGRLAVFDAYIADKPDNEMYMSKLHTKVFRGWNLPDPISTEFNFLKCAGKAGFKIIKNKDVTERILECSAEIVPRVKFLRRFTPLANILIYLKKRNVGIPILSNIGLDDKAIFHFADTAELQYDMFKSGDTEFRIIVLEK